MRQFPTPERKKLFLGSVAVFALAAILFPAQAQKVCQS